MATKSVTVIEPDPMIVHSRMPLNREPRLALLREVVTPNSLFFVRSHGTTPEIDPTSYRLEVKGLCRSRQFSLAQIKEMPQATITATLQCAGNRRSELLPIREFPNEVAWQAQAIGTARWTGVRLRDVISAVSPNAKHVAFCGRDQTEVGSFGASISLTKAMSPEVILAWAMNGEPLTPEHGAPLRVVVPGFIGARSVKWLDQIMIQHLPSENFFQTQSYHLVPLVVTDTRHYGQELQEMPVTSVIVSPAHGSILEQGTVAFYGYAVGTGNCAIQAVELSTDWGENWISAELEGSSEWCWTFWHTEMPLRSGKHNVFVRARDSRGYEQPRDPYAVLNANGYANNSWHSIRLVVR